MGRKSLRWLIPLTLFVIAVAFCGGCGLWPGGAIPSETWAILDQADEWELYSLFPEHEEKSLPERFAGWPVLGKTTLRDAETRKRLREALAQGTRRYHQWFPGPACFFPRHGIHASYGGKSVDLVICFECGYVYQNDLKGEVHTTATPQPAFDAALTEAGVPLAPSGGPPWKLPGSLKGSEKESANTPPQLPPLHRGMPMFRVNEMLGEPVSVDELDGGDYFAVHCQGSERIGNRVTIVIYGADFGGGYAVGWESETIPPE
jgi:hypothetical protein